jgi:hypothetical protein
MGKPRLILSTRLERTGGAELRPFHECTTLPALIESFCGSEAISFSA